MSTDSIFARLLFLSFSFPLSLSRRLRTSKDLCLYADRQLPTAVDRPTETLTREYRFIRTNSDTLGTMDAHVNLVRVELYAEGNMRVCRFWSSSVFAFLSTSGLWFGQ